MAGPHMTVTIISFQQCRIAEASSIIVKCCISVCHLPWWCGELMVWAKTLSPLRMVIAKELTSLMKQVSCSPDSPLKCSTPPHIIKGMHQKREVTHGARLSWRWQGLGAVLHLRHAGPDSSVAGGQQGLHHPVLHSAASLAGCSKPHVLPQRC